MTAPSTTMRCRLRKDLGIEWSFACDILILQLVTILVSAVSEVSENLRNTVHKMLKDSPSLAPSDPPSSPRSRPTPLPYVYLKP